MIPCKLLTEDFIKEILRIKENINSSKKYIIVCANEGIKKLFDLSRSDDSIESVSINNYLEPNELFVITKEDIINFELPERHKFYKYGFYINTLTEKPELPKIASFYKYNEEERKMRNITIMIGAPRSGKTTKVNEIKTNEVIVSADSLRQLIYGQRFYSQGEPMMWAVRKLMLEYLMKQGLDIIIDETNITKSSRAEIIKLAKKYGYDNIIGKVVFTPKDKCIERAKDTNQEDLIPIIEKMFEQFEKPEVEEGFTKLDVIF